MKLQTAKKEHVCCLCKQPIEVGTKYWREYQEDGQGNVILDHKEHTNCASFEVKVTVQEQQP